MVALAGFRRCPAGRVRSVGELEHWLARGVVVLASPKQGFAPAVPCQVVGLAGGRVVLETVLGPRFAVEFDRWSFWQGF